MPDLTAEQKQARRCADITQVACVIAENGLTDQQARAINARTGWTFDVIYPDVAREPGFRDGTSWTRVEGRHLGSEELKLAIEGAHRIQSRHEDI